MAFSQFSDQQQIIDYVRSYSDYFPATADLQVTELSDGNLNYVYRINDTEGNSLILKQTPPYIRVIGEGWPLTQDRARIEYNSLKHTADRCPGSVPAVYHYDAEHCVILMQDIGDHHNLREQLIARVKLPELANQLAEYLATTKFYGSGMGLPSAAHKQLVKESQNPELCQIHEEVFFLDPFCNHERNDVNPALQSEAEAYWQNSDLKREVAILKRRYMSDTEALLHGDLHTGSVFANQNGCKVIDMEFAFCGPAGFDTGVLLANLLLNYCGQRNLPGDAEERADYQDWLLTTLTELWQAFSQRFTALMQTQCVDPSLSDTGYQQWYLQQLWQDTLGYAGVEMSRRILGIAHVADIAAIASESDRADSERLALQIAERLILDRSIIQSAPQLADTVRQLNA